MESSNVGNLSLFIFKVRNKFLIETLSLPPLQSMATNY